MELATTQHALVAIFCSEFYGYQTEIQKARLCYIYALEESMAFITPIFIELSLPQQH